VSAYRDRYEQCPRCRVDLVTAGSVRSCPRCNGHWVSVDVLREMAQAMVDAGATAKIQLVADRHPHLPCATCEVPMETWALHGVAVDRCAAHGLWFDRTELEAVLYATAGQSNAHYHEKIQEELDALAELLKKDDER
jgi:Zn-finger nucleic acid-binding protein